MAKRFLKLFALSLLHSAEQYVYQATLMPCLLELMKISVRVNKNARSADI
ncbi:uncharacterized protein METZ01_LOCUS429103 [marine metagenome]|uniref:Uncharacterized protein n=1 Tax=marine metagenome TaxID=408172 RepID=A0A382XZM2_9ZZZZ